MNEARPPKRERTRRKLLEAGLRVLADRGDALTASEVVVAADVSNGTFYNHFLDRDDLIAALAHESLKAITENSADETEGAEPGWRFAVASTRVLAAAADEPLWGRAVLRLSDCPTPPFHSIQQHLRADLAEGYRTGRFTHGDDPVTIDLVTGTLMATVRRLTTPHRSANRRYTTLVTDVVTRLLEAIGVEPDEARALATAARDATSTDAGAETGATAP